MKDLVRLCCRAACAIATSKLVVTVASISSHVSPALTMLGSQNPCSKIALHVVRKRCESDTASRRAKVRYLFGPLNNASQVLARAA